MTQNLPLMEMTLTLTLTLALALALALAANNPYPTMPSSLVVSDGTS